MRQVLTDSSIPEAPIPPIPGRACRIRLFFGMGFLVTAGEFSPPAVPFCRLANALVKAGHFGDKLLDAVDGESGWACVVSMS